MIIKKGDTILGIHPELLERMQEEGFKESGGVLTWDGGAMILLEEATKEQFIDEMIRRYPAHIFAGVPACQQDGDNPDMSLEGERWKTFGLISFIDKFMTADLIEAKLNGEE